MNFNSVLTIRRINNKIRYIMSRVSGAHFKKVARILAYVDYISAGSIFEYVGMYIHSYVRDIS